MKSFSGDLRAAGGGWRVLVVGHRATQHGLDHWLPGVPLAQATTAPWPWQPGCMLQAPPRPN